MDNFLELNALKVEQPLGNFYVISIAAKDLLEIAFSEPLRYVDNSGKVQGSQRVKDLKRLKEIGKYIDSVEMAFPNTIILSANYTQQGYITKDESERWKVQELSNGLCKIIIPKKIKLAAIIDGQHRISAFEFVENKSRLTDLQLICSVYFDLPNSYKAFLFATINSNQKKVDRSLALEQFGYNVEDEPEKAWTPEKLSVFLSRKFNVEVTSPLYQHVKVAPLNIDNLVATSQNGRWVVSTATIVDGICGLISSNPKRDRILMQQKGFLSGRSREMIKDVRDYSPMRNLFISQKDKTIYDTVTNYLIEVDKYFWQKASSQSYIFKTVGVQAIFDILKSILKKEITDSPEKIDFASYLSKAASIDFSDKFFQSSGIGRGRIRNSIGILINLVDKEKIKKVDLPFYEQIFANKSTNIDKEKWIWEEEAENVITNSLEQAEWNFDTNTIGLYLSEEEESPTIFKSYDDLYSQLSTLAETAFNDNLPSDSEFAEEQREKFDLDDLIQSSLIEYEDNLKRIKWI